MIKTIEVFLGPVAKTLITKNPSKQLGKPRGHDDMSMFMEPWDIGKIPQVSKHIISPSYYSLMLLVCLCCENLIHLIRYKEVKTLIILIIQGLIIFHTRSI